MNWSCREQGPVNTSCLSPGPDSGLPCPSGYIIKGCHTTAVVPDCGKLMHPHDSRGHFSAQQMNRGTPYHQEHPRHGEHTWYHIMALAYGSTCSNLSHSQITSVVGKLRHKVAEVTRLASGRSRIFPQVQTPLPQPPPLPQPQPAGQHWEALSQINDYLSPNPLSSKHHS